MVKNPPPSAGDTEDVSLIPGSGRHPGVGKDSPLQDSCLEIPGQRRLVGCSPWVAELDTTEHRCTHWEGESMWVWWRWSRPPTFMDGQPRFTPTAFRPHMLVGQPHHSASRPLFPHILPLTAVPSAPGCSANYWAAPWRPTRPALSQLKDQRKSPELKPEILMV